MDVFLIIITILLFLLLIYISIYLLALYCHPQDAGFGASLFCKLLVVLGFTFSWAQILILTLDISNTRYSTGLDMNLAWTILYISMFIMLLFFIPFAIFFYETDEDKPFCSRICMTLFQEFVTLAFVATIFTLGYFYLNVSSIPVQVVSQENSQKESSEIPLLSIQHSIRYQSHINIYKSEVHIYFLGLCCFLGYFLFFFFGGIGLTALPLDMIDSFRFRPVQRTSKDASSRRDNLKKKSNQLIQIAKKLKENEKEVKFDKSWWSRRKLSNKQEFAFQKLNEAVGELEMEIEIFFEELQLENSNPIVYILKLLLGIIFFITSILWELHILLYFIISKNDFPVSSFLNTIYLDLERYQINFMAIGFFCYFTFYLIWCVIKGNLKLGCSIPYLVKFHPMKINETWMNSFLFNIVIVILSSISIAHFCLTAFSQYTRLTELNQILVVQIQNQKFISWMFYDDIVYIAFFSWSLLCMFIQMFCSCRRKRIVDQEQLQVAEIEIELKEYLIKK